MTTTTDLSKIKLTKARFNLYATSSVNDWHTEVTDQIDSLILESKDSIVFENVYNISNLPSRVLYSEIRTELTKRFPNKQIRIIERTKTINKGVTHITFHIRGDRAYSCYSTCIKAFVAIGILPIESCLDENEIIKRQNAFKKANTINIYERFVEPTLKNIVDEQDTNSKTDYYTYRSDDKAVSININDPTFKDAMRKLFEEFGYNKILKDSNIPYKLTVPANFVMQIDMDAYSKTLLTNEGE